MMKICEGHLFYEEKGKAYDVDEKRGQENVQKH